MEQKLIFYPFFGVMLLTMSVWVYMYCLRLFFLKRENINPQSVSTTRQVLNIVPDKINNPSENLINLFELPLLFYALCIYLYVTQQVDSVSLYMSFFFLLLRIGHSVIHCTYNKVIHRFVLYVLSSIILWVLIIREFISAVHA